MNTNITTDNYEAYLLDYMDGNLSPDETEQLKAFVKAQGLDWAELTEELPHLEAPQITFEGKDSLKKKNVVVPLYVKIASAAAAAGLLLTVGLWPEKSLPQVEPIAELKPILPERLITASETTTLPPRTIHYTYPQVVKKKNAVIPERVETPLIAQLEPQKAQTLPTLPTFDEPNFDLLAYQMDVNLAFTPYDEFDVAEYDNEERLSLIGRGLLWLSGGKHASFGSLINDGLSQAKQKAADAATDMALAAYYRADDRIEEARERWDEKYGK